MPVSDATWICQTCGGDTAKRDEASTMHVCYMHCPKCDMMTQHKTIVSDQPASKLGRDLL